MNQVQEVGAQVIIVGNSPIAEIAYEYITCDSPHRVAAFSVEKRFIRERDMMGLPVEPFEDIEIRYPPNEFKILVAVGYTDLNRLRTRFFREAKGKGYSLISYVSSRAFVWRDVEIGENCFIFEDNTIQPFVKIGNNVTLWSGNHIGHHSVIEDNCFISSHVVVSGFCRIGRNSFLGVNAALSHRTTIERDNVIAMGAVITKDTLPEKIYVGHPAKPLNKSSFETTTLYRSGQR
jgi:sugar O-acyltransferase (sialic acid O-acetyltransferase NeuD family)